MDTDVLNIFDSEYLPLLPLRNVIVFPKMITPLLVGREESLNSIDKAQSDNSYVLLATQKKKQGKSKKY